MQDANPMQVTHIYDSIQKVTVKIPLYVASVSAGFPSPADDFVDTNLDLNQYLIKSPASTFFVRASGDSMIGAGIHSGDILVVDKSIEAYDNAIVIAVLEAELTVKRLHYSGKRIILLPENPVYKPIDVTENEEFRVWGVVTAVIRKIS